MREQPSKRAYGLYSLLAVPATGRPLLIVIIHAVKIVWNRLREKIMMNSANNGWIKLWRELLNRSIWTQSSPQCCKVLITILLLANHDEKEWEYMGHKYQCKPGQLVTSIDSLVKACGTGVTKDGVRSAITRLVKLGFITNVSTKTGRLITVVNWDKYQGVSHGNPIANTNGDTMVDPKATPNPPQRYPKDTPPNKKDKKYKNDKNEKNIITDTQGGEVEYDDTDWWQNYLQANGEEVF